jgi:hypothetical protein
MDISVETEGSGLARAVLARSRLARREVTAVQLDDSRPAYYVADEVVVDANDPDLVREYVNLGGEVVHDGSDPELPREFRELGLGRDEPLDTSGLPRSVTLRFRELPEARSSEVGQALERADLPAERVRFASERGLALSSLLLHARLDGRGAWLNEVGTDAATLTQRKPLEGGGSNPLTWPTMSGLARISQAWQLVESMRMVRSAEPLVWLCVCDSGFWWDASGGPGSPAAAALADLGRGAPLWNLVTDSQGVPTGPGRTNYHGQNVASAAGAAVGNSLGSAGSGGTVARIAYFNDDRTAETAKRAMVRCTQWGIPFVVYSGEFDSVELFFGTSAWNDTFNWAADNGTIMFAAAGNKNRNLPDDAVQRPATRTPRTLTVGATNVDGTKWSLSSWGSSVNVWAPGVQIPVGPTPIPTAGTSVSGTSFSAPLAAGVAAMVRAVNRSLSVDQVRDLLVNTAWNGADKVTKGLDAYAAVWAAMEARFTESGTESKPEQLFPHADGTFTPVFNNAINRKGDTDTFRLEVKTFSTLTLDLQWYQQLASLRLELENENAEGLAPIITATNTAESAHLTAQIGTGTYQVKVIGDAPTAYLLSGKLTAGVLLPDYLEPNDSFEHATRVEFVAPVKFGMSLYRLLHGPGWLDLTLHTTTAPSSTTDQDFFRFDAPKSIGSLQVPKITITSDEPVEVTLFDSARAELTTWRKAHVSIGFNPGDNGYIKVAGATHTRYRLWVGTQLSPALGRRWEEVHILPKWWETGPHPDWVIGPEEFRGILIDEPALADGALHFADAGSVLLPEGMRLELLNSAGEPIREADITEEAISVSVEGLEPGAYVLHIQSSATPETPIGLAPVMPPSLR